MEATISRWMEKEDGAHIHNRISWVSEVAPSCPTLCNPMDCSPPGSLVHGIFQAWILEWVAISFSRGSSQPRDRTQVSRVVGRCFTVWATREALTLLWGVPKSYILNMYGCGLNLIKTIRRLKHSNVQEFCLMSSVLSGYKIGYASDETKLSF